MPWLGRLADACCGKVIWLMHATARRTTWNILRQGEPGRFCSEWASNVVFDERVTIPYISEGVMTWCFLRRFFRRGRFFRLRCLGIATFGTFFEQTNDVWWATSCSRRCFILFPFSATQNCCLFCDLHDLAFRLAGRIMSNSLFARFCFVFQ